MADALILTDDTFQQEVLEATEPVLVDFGAAWCGPCRTLEPVVEELAREYDGRIEVRKADYDDVQKIATEYRIRSLPTVLFFKDGKETDRLVGAVPKKRLVEQIEALL